MLILEIVPVLGTNPCLSYFVTSGIKYIGKSNLKVKRLVLVYSSRGKHFIMAAGSLERRMAGEPS